MVMKYKKNPDVKGNCSVDGVIFDDNTVVAGDRWTKWSMKTHPMHPPILVRTSDDAVVTAWHPSDNAPKIPTQDKSPRSVISTIPIADRIRADQEEKMAREAAEEAARKSFELDDRNKNIVKNETKPDDLFKEEETEKIKVSLKDKSEYTIKDIPNIGDAKAEALMKAGYITVGSVAKSDAKSIVDALKKNGIRANAVTARQIIRSAQTLQ